MEAYVTPKLFPFVTFHNIKRLILLFAHLSGNGLTTRYPKARHHESP